MRKRFRKSNRVKYRKVKIGKSKRLRNVYISRGGIRL